MTELEERVRNVFQDAFGEPPKLVARAPGRVNLIGERVDYGDGWVLPMAIDNGTIVCAGPGIGNAVEVVAADYDQERDRIALDRPLERCEESRWANHPRGIVSALQTSGIKVAGARLAIGGDVPQGAGLSSSASLGVATAAALAQLAGAELDYTQLALIAQSAEREFVGTNCGIMDQLVIARAQAGAALLIDCRSLAVEPVPLPGNAAVLVVGSGVRRELAAGAYNDRRREVEAAARHYDVAALRDLTQAQLEAGRAGLDETLYRRARHQVTENARTLAAAKALRDNDLAAFGRLMNASHASLRDDFAVSVPAMDRLVALLQDAIGENGGARMTGGGFGGAAVALCEREALPDVRIALANGYRTPAGKVAVVTECQPASGMKVRLV